MKKIALAEAQSWLEGDKTWERETSEGFGGTEASADGGRWWQMTGRQVTRDALLTLPLDLRELFQPSDVRIHVLGFKLPASWSYSEMK